MHKTNAPAGVSHGGGTIQAIGRFPSIQQAHRYHIYPISFIRISCTSLLSIPRYPMVIDGLE